MKAEFNDIKSNLGKVVALLENSQRWKLSAALVLMAIAGALTNVPPVVLGKLLDKFIDQSAIAFADAIPFLGVIFSSIVVREAIQVGRKYLVEDTCTRAEKTVRVNLVYHMLRLDLSYFAEKQTGSLHGRMNRSIEGLINLIKLSFLDFLPSAFVAIFAIGVVLYRAPVLGLVMALVIPFGIWIVLLQVASQKGIRIKLLRDKEEIDGAVVELLSGIDNVRALNTEKYEKRRVEGISERLRAREIVHHIWMAGYDAAKYINEGIFHIIVLALAIWFASIGSITTGDILTYSMLFIGVVTPLREIHRILDEAHESSIRTSDLFEFLNVPEDESFKTLPQKTPQYLPEDNHALIIENLDFAYPGAAQLSLSGINLKVRKGEFIGICGSTGCGKTTLLKVLLRLIHPDGGAVKIGGRDLGGIGRSELAQMVAYVSQSPFLVSGTVFENITYGINAASQKEVEKAAKKARIHDEIMQFPNGYDTTVGERGGKLSGGQRQRIAIARAFLRTPKLLVLDEATSALDNRNESAVQKSIEELMENTAVLAVAHRLTTLQNADRLVVLEAGKIVQVGTFHEITEKEHAPVSVRYA